MKLSRVGIVFNPKGGSARGNRFQSLVAQLLHHGIEPLQAATTAAPDSAINLASQFAKQNVDLVIGMGGDWIARSVAEGLLGTGVPAAIYPGGTGNLFARTYYNVPSAERFVEMIRLGQPQLIDLIAWSAQPFVQGQPEQHGFSIVAVGFGSLLDAIGDADPVWKKRFGRAVYAHNMAKAVAHPKPVTATLSVGGLRKQEDLAAALFLNVPPPEVPSLSRGCNASDGLLDFVGLRSGNLAQMAKAGLQIGLGYAEQSGRYCQPWRTGQLVVQTDRPVQLNIDGDPGPETDHLTLSVTHAAVPLILA